MENLFSIFHFPFSDFATAKLENRKRRMDFSFSIFRFGDCEMENGKWGIHFPFSIFHFHFLFRMRSLDFLIKISLNVDFLSHAKVVASCRPRHPSSASTCGCWKKVGVPATHFPFSCDHENPIFHFLAAPARHFPFSDFRVLAPEGRWHVYA